MPPPRRFSAAPTLTCPHRNKSSSHSSSSLHHTYSIDSSESMITVIPANRGQEFAKRSSRGSISCNSGQGIDQSGSFYALPRSPLSPRSPSRCSPGLLTPNTNDPPTGLEPPYSPANTNTTTGSSTGPTTVVNQQQQTLKWISASSSTAGQATTLLPAGGDQQQAFVTDGSENNDATAKACLLAVSSPSSPSGLNNLTLPLCGGPVDEDDSSLAVENGTSFNSSRHEQDDFGADNGNDDADSACAGGSQTELEEADEEDISGLNYPTIGQNEYSRPHNKQQDYSTNDNTTSQQQQELINLTAPPATSNIDPNLPIVCETINDFCARHSREELESLVGQIGCLKISDCYFSERSSTLCMVIEIEEE